MSPLEKSVNKAYAPKNGNFRNDFWPISTATKPNCNTSDNFQKIEIKALLDIVSHSAVKGYRHPPRATSTFYAKRIPKLLWCEQGITCRSGRAHGRIGAIGRCWTTWPWLRLPWYAQLSRHSTANASTRQHPSTISDQK